MLILAQVKKNTHIMHSLFHRNGILALRKNSIIAHYARETIGARSTVYSQVTLICILACSLVFAAVTFAELPPADCMRTRGALYGPFRPSVRVTCDSMQGWPAYNRPRRESTEPKKCCARALRRVKMLYSFFEKWKTKRTHDTFPSSSENLVSISISISACVPG